MIADVARRFAMLSRAERIQWAAMAPVGVVAAALEAIGGALVFALLTFVVEPAAAGRGHLAQFVGRYVVHADGPDQGSAVLTLALCAAAVHVVRNVLLVVLAWWRTRAVSLSTAALSTRLLGAYMSAPWPFHLRRGSAALMEAVRDGTPPFFEVFGATAAALTEMRGVIALCAVMHCGGAGGSDVPRRR